MPADRLRNCSIAAIIAVAAGSNSGCAAPTQPVRCSQDATTVAFANLATTAQGSRFSRYSEGGFTVAAASGPWTWENGYVAPGSRSGRENYLTFSAPNGTTLQASLSITSRGCPFTFRSLALYSSTTPIPYEFIGLRHGAIVFSVGETLPHTRGTWRTVSNPSAAEPIDRLGIVVTNAPLSVLSPGANPVGVAHLILNQ